MRRLVLVFALSAMLTGCNPVPEPPPFKAIVETKDLMEDLMERQADIVWGATGSIVTSSIARYLG